MLHSSLSVSRSLRPLTALARAPLSCPAPLLFPCSLTTNDFVGTAPPLAADVANYSYGRGHPMQPQRARVAHNLMLNYGLMHCVDMKVCWPAIG